MAAATAKEWSALMPDDGQSRSMTSSAKLSPALIESLFDRGAPLYSSDTAQFEAVARGDKGNCEQTFHGEGGPWTANFIAEAKRFGLSITRREVSVGGDRAVVLCATRPGEEWQAEVLTWVFNPGTRGFARSEQSTYLQSRAFGYTHEQCVQWIEMCRHQSPVHNRTPIVFLLPLAAAWRVSAAKGQLTLREPLTIVAPLLFYGGLRRNALDLLPAGFAIGRSAIKRQTIPNFFHFKPHQVLVAECAAKSCASLAESLLAPIDFWDGTRWTSQPTAS